MTAADCLLACSINSTSITTIAASINYLLDWIPIGVYNISLEIAF